MKSHTKRRMRHLGKDLSIIRRIALTRYHISYELTVFARPHGYEVEVWRQEERLWERLGSCPVETCHRRGVVVATQGLTAQYDNDHLIQYAHHEG